MVDRHITKALVEVSLFLECSGEEDVDLDAAVAALEQIGATLQLSDEATKRALTAGMRELAVDYPSNEEFVRNLPETLGFAID